MFKARSSVLQLRANHRPDYFLGLVAFGLIAVGMIVIYSTGSIVNFNISGGTTDRNSFFAQQLISLVIGLGGWFAASRVPYTTWKKWSPWMLGGALFLMLLVFVPGISGTSRGASRWIRLGPASFQPAEFLKLSTVLFMATWADTHREELRRARSSFLPVFGLFVVILVLTVILQRDMGTGIVLVAAGLAVYFMSEVPLHLFGLVVGGLIGSGAAMIAIFPYRLARLSTFFNRKDDLTGADYHINQALIALGSGGVIGKGLGNSLQSYGYLPESTNDSIYAIIGEQFGLFGTLIVLGLFSTLLWRCYRIIRRAPDRFARMVAAGLTVWLIAQAFINIAAMLNLIPLTGIPLPFISYGGTSLLASMVAIGILQNISRYTEREASYEDSSVRRRNRGSRYTADRSERRTPTPLGV